MDHASAASSQNSSSCALLLFFFSFHYSLARRMHTTQLAPIYNPYASRYPMKQITDAPKRLRIQHTDMDTLSLSLSLSLSPSLPLSLSFSFATYQYFIPQCRCRWEMPRSWRSSLQHRKLLFLLRLQAFWCRVVSVQFRIRQF